MPFKLNAYLPSKKQEVQIKELYYKQYRELIKSLYNTNKKETVQQYNSILQDLCPEIESLNITFEDKLSLLLTVRNYCVSPDLKLKITVKDGNMFNYSVPVEKLIEQIKTIDKSNILQIDKYEIGISSYKAQDEWVFIGNNNDRINKLASYIDYIKIESEKLDFKDISFAERNTVVQTLPAYLVELILQNIQAVEEYYEGEDFLAVKNPITKDSIPVLRISKNFNHESIQQIIELIFTEDLNNVYRAFFNMVNYAGFSAEYVDTITPIEAQVYWMYYIQDNEKKTSDSSNTQLSLPASVPNQELGFQ